MHDSFLWGNLHETIMFKEVTDGWLMSKYTIYYEAFLMFTLVWSKLIFYPFILLLLSIIILLRGVREIAVCFIILFSLALQGGNNFCSIKLEL